MTDLVPVGDRVLTLPTTVDFATLVQDADVRESFSLERGKDVLLGVPFVITKVSYRDGVKRDGQPTNYVSLEIVVAPDEILKDYASRGRLVDLAGNKLANARVRGNETLVINDGGTGICRQITQYLHDKRIIDVGPVGGDVGGPMGTSAFDRYRGEWVTLEVGPAEYDVKLLVMGGLRASGYVAGATGQDATTYYLA